MPEIPPPVPPIVRPPTPPPRKRRSRLLYGCGLLAGIFLLICLTVAIAVWYMQRPIKPVVLSQTEKAVVEEKIQRISASDEPVRKTAPDKPAEIELDRPYQPGSKILRLTEREMNGLLNQNTDLGKTVRLEFGRNAINAYIVAPIPKDAPIMGGKTFRARGRFRISVTQGEEPYAVLEDVTVFGISLPKAWLGGLKGENLLADAVGRRDGEPVLKGIKSLRVEPGALLIELED